MTDTVPEPTSSGHCMCEGVSYEVTGALRDVLNCHCWRCRRWSGHHMAAFRAAADSVRFRSDETLSWYQCGDGAEYGFCSRCGASVGWRHEGHPGRISLCAGLLDPPTGLTTSMTIYASTAGDYHQLDPNVPSWPLEHD